MTNAATKNEVPQLPQAADGRQALAPLPTHAPMMLGSDAYRVGLEPTTLHEAYKLAELIASTRICGVESAEDALVRMLTGRSLGLSTMQSLRGVYNVKGRPSLDASLMQALCLQSPLCEYFDLVSSDETQATYKTKRKGRAERQHTFTIADADKQGLVERGRNDDGSSANNYVRMPKQMLRARCKSELARIEYSDLMFGMYSREELEAGMADGDIEDAAARIRREEGDIEVEIVPSPVQAAKRDYAAEAEELIAKARGASSRTELAAVRQAFEAWDGVEPHRSKVAAAYNEAKAALRKSPAADAAATTTSASAPAAMPDGNLFDKGPGKP